VEPEFFYAEVFGFWKIERLNGEGGRSPAQKSREKNRCGLRFWGLWLEFFEEAIKSFRQRVALVQAYLAPFATETVFVIVM